MKPLEENVEVNFHNFEFVNIFLYMTPKTCAIEEKNR